jgi:hypothetical protein
MTIDTKTIKEEMKFLDMMMHDIEENDKEAADEIRKRITTKSDAYTQKMQKKVKLSQRSVDEQEALATKIEEQIMHRGAMKRIMIESIREVYEMLGGEKFSDKEIYDAVERIGDVVAGASTPAPTSTSTAPTTPPPTTPSGLPKQDPTPVAKKLPKEKKKRSFGDKLKKMARAAIRMNPIFGEYMDNLDEEEARLKKKDRDESATTGGNTDTGRASTGISSKEAIKLLRKIEENTRGLGGNGAVAGNKGSAITNFKDLVSKGIRGFLGKTEEGRFIAKSYDTVKSTLGGAFNLGPKITEKYNEVGGLKGIKEKLGNTVVQGKKWASKMIHRADRSLQYSKYGDKYLGMQWAAKEKFRDVKNGFKSAVSNVNERISSLNPFREGRTAEEKGEAARAKGPTDTSGILKKIEEHTKGAKKHTKFFGEALEKLGKTLFSMFSSLPKLLGGLGGAAGKLGGAAMSAGGSVLSAASKFAMPAIAVGAAGAAGYAVGSWINDKLLTDSNGESRLQKSTADQLKEVNDPKNPETIKTLQAELDKKIRSGGKIGPAFAKMLDESGIKYDKAMVVSPVAKSAPELKTTNASAAESKHSEVPRAIETGAIAKESLEQKIDKKGTAQAIAPIVNSPTTNISNGTTTTSVRLHPRNQESTWIRYMEGKYAC